MRIAGLLVIVGLGAGAAPASTQLASDPEEALHMIRTLGVGDNSVARLLGSSMLSDSLRESFADSLVALAIGDTTSIGRLATPAVSGLRLSASDRYGRSYENSVPRLARVFREADADFTRLMAMQAIASVGAATESALEIRREGATSERSLVAWAAVDILREMGDAGLRVLCEIHVSGTGRMSFVIQSLEVWADQYGWTDCGRPPVPEVPRRDL